MKIKPFNSFKYLAVRLSLFAAGGSLQAQTMSFFASLDSPTNGATIVRSCAASGTIVTLNATAYLTYCTPGGGGSGPTNEPPQCTNYPMDYVDFYANNVLIGTDLTSSSGFQYSITWTNPAVGTYQLKAIAVYDVSGAISSTNTITVVDPSLSITSISSSAFAFAISAAPGSVWGVSKSTDLETWTAAGNVTASGGTATFTDSTITDVPYRFYKATNGTCCLEPVGFVRRSATPGWIALANQLDVSSTHDPAQNTLSSIFSRSSLPSGTVLLKGNDTYNWNGTAWSTNITLSPGEGAFLQNNTSNAFTVTFAGYVRSGQFTRPLSAQRISSMFPLAGGLTSVLGYNPLDGDYVLKWNPEGQGYNFYMYFDEFGWWDGGDEPVEPVFDVGESLYISVPNSNNWTQALSPCP